MIFSIIFFLLAAVLPYVLLIAVLAALTVLAARKRSKFRPLLMTALTLTTLLVTGFVVWTQHGILTSKSSTAGIAYIYLPFYTLMATAVLATAALSLTYAVFFILENIRRVETRATNLPLTVVAVFVLVFYGWRLERHWHQQEMLRQAASPSISAENLSLLQNKSLTVNNIRVLKKLAANPNLSDADLHTLLDIAVSGKHFELLVELAGNRRLSAADLSRICQLTSYQTEGWNYSIWPELAGNPRTAPDDLAALAGVVDHIYTRQRVAANPSTPSATLLQLAIDDASSVSNSAKARAKERGLLLLKVKVLRLEGGSKYRWGEFQILETLTNPPGKNFPPQMRLAWSSSADWRLTPETVAVIQVEKYADSGPAAKEDLWKITNLIPCPNYENK